MAEHRRAAEFDQHQRLDRGLPLGKVRFLIRKVGDVARRVAPGDQPSAVGQRGSTNSRCQPVERFAMSRPKDIKPDSEEPRDRLPLYPEIGFRHKFTEMIDAPTNAHRYRVTDRSVLVISSGPYGHPAGATGVHARRTATLPEAVGRRQRGSAMFAAKPHEAEQELPKSIPEPRNVTRECRRPVRGRKTWHARTLLAREPGGLRAGRKPFGRTVRGGC
jgi:hypothetical protein